MRTKEETLKEINKNRKACKDNWWVYSGKTTQGEEIKIKAYNTWIQKMQIGDVKYSGGMDISVKEFSKYLMGLI